MPLRVACRAWAAAVGLIAACAGSEVGAQTQPAQLEAEEVVVTARRIGVPVWRVTNDSSTVVLIADVNVPAGAPWRPQELEKAVAGARSIFIGAITGEGGAAAAAARAQGIVRRRDARAAVPPELGARLDRIPAARRLKRSRGAQQLGVDLLIASMRGQGVKDNGRDLALRAARKHKVRQREFRGFRSVDLVEPLAQAQGQSIACLKASIDHAERAEADAQVRAVAWRQVDIPALLDTRVEAARRACSDLHGGVRGAKALDHTDRVLTEALSEPGVTVAVLPLWLLGDPGGLLDRLDRRYAVNGPRWTP